MHLLISRKARNRRKLIWVNKKDDLIWYKTPEMEIPKEITHVTHAFQKQTSVFLRRKDLIAQCEFIKRKHMANKHYHLKGLKRSQDYAHRIMMQMQFCKCKNITTHLVLMQL